MTFRSILKPSATRALAIAFAALFSTAAFADGEAEYKYRDSVMKAVGGHMASMGAILRGKVRFEDFALHANAMRDLAGVVPHVFPEGSGGGDSEALPAIWEKPDEFKAAVDKFVTAANGIADAAGGGDMGKIGPAVQALGQSCKNCHDNFREED